MFDLTTDAIFTDYSIGLANQCNDFICGEEDIDNFFIEDVFLYENELLGKSYCWLDKNNPSEIIAIITLAYNGINLTSVDNSSKNKFQRPIPNSKRHENYPAVLIGRLGVNIKYQEKGYNIGSQILKFIRIWFKLPSNKAACRFILVDAINKPKPLHLYEKNGYKALYKSEEREKEAFGISEETDLKTRIYYLDLK